VVIAALTKGGLVISGVLIPPDPLPAAGAEHRGGGKAALTEELLSERDQLFRRQALSAGITAFQMAHGHYLHR
jgi:hypothetical protein